MLVSRPEIFCRSLEGRRVAFSLVRGGRHIQIVGEAQHVVGAVAQDFTSRNTAQGRRVHYSVGFDLDARARSAITKVPELPTRTTVLGRAAVRTGGDRRLALPTVRHQHPRPAAGVARSPPPCPRPRGGLHPLRCGKATELDHLPSTSLAINAAWCVAASIAADLLSWLRLLCLDRALADAKPKTLRNRILHTAARIVRGQRRRKIKIPETWPWARELETAFLTAFALTAPT